MEGESSTTSEQKQEMFLTTPDVITAQWVSEALKKGQIEKDGKIFFFRPYPRSDNERVWLTDNYGLPIPGPEGEGFIYHGTNIERLPNIIESGVFGIPKHPTLSHLNNYEVLNAARHVYSRIGIGLIAVWRSPWDDIEIQGTGWPEPMGWPTKKYEGSREELDLPDHLKNAEDLRQLPPDNLIGFYVFDRDRKT